MPGFWIISVSEDDNSELRSYDSAEYESEEINSDEEEVEEQQEELEIEEEEGDEIEESENDIEVMEILASSMAEAQKQNHIEKRPEPTKIDKNEKIEVTTANNLSTVGNENIVDKKETKVCMSKRELEKMILLFAQSF